MYRWFAVLALIFTLYACDSGSGPPPGTPPAKEERTKTVLDDQIKAIDKAKAVEEMEMERKRKQDEQLDGGG